MKKVSKAQASGDRKPIKTWSRRSTITPDFVGLNFTVHNGKNFLPVRNRNMVGHKLGEFSATRSFKSHNFRPKRDYGNQVILQIHENLSQKSERSCRILPGKKATEGVSILKFISQKPPVCLKTLRSAMANAENNSNLNADDLIISEAIVESGPAKAAPGIRSSQEKNEPFAYYLNRRSLIYYGTES